LGVSSVRGIETIEEGVVEFVAAGLVVVVLVVGTTLDRAGDTFV